MIVAIAIGHGQAIVKESDVKLAGFEDAGNLLVVIGRMGVIARLRVTPGARQVRAILRLQESRSSPSAVSYPVSWKLDDPSWEDKLILERRRRTSGPSSTSMMGISAFVG
jgi:hypothetical protein